MPIRWVCSLILQSPVKLQDPDDFFISCCIGDVYIEGALCDLGSSVSLMPLSLCRKLKLLDLTPTTISIQLADCSTRQLVSILEDIPVRVDDMDESTHVPIILGRPFLATAGVAIDVKTGTIYFWMCGERADFCFPPRHHNQLLSPPHLLQHLCLQFLLMLSLGLRFLMEMEDSAYGLQHMMLLCQSQLVFGSLLSVLGGS